MSADTIRPMNPVPEEFAGSSFSRGLKRAFHATRPKFFTASILPVIVGSAWGAYAGDSFSWYVFGLALLATVCVHAASNGLCDNGLFCDGAETCDAVNDCQSGTPPIVDDGVGCTDDSCNEITDSCDNVVNNGNCDDRSEERL